MHESNLTCLDDVDHELRAQPCEVLYDLIPESIGVYGARGGCKDIPAVKAESVLLVPQGASLANNTSQWSHNLDDFGENVLHFSIAFVQNASYSAFELTFRIQLSLLTLNALL